MSMNNDQVFIRIGTGLIRRDTIVAIFSHPDGDARVWTGNGDQNSEYFRIPGCDCMELFSRIYPDGTIIDPQCQDVEGWSAE